MTDSEWDDYNRDGTYSYPPEPVCAEQVIAFWRRCPIPDSVLAQVQRAHADVRKRMIDDWVENRHPLSGRPTEKAFKPESKQAAAKWDLDRQEAISAAEEYFPPAPMPTGKVRDIVRMMRAVRQAADSSLPDHEFEKVRTEPAGMKWSGYELTWVNVCHYFGQPLYAEWVWQDPAIRDTGKLDVVTQQLADLTETVNRIRDGQDADFLTRGKSQRQAERALRDAGYTKS